jgi:hypothetical protein
MKICFHLLLMPYIKRFHEEYLHDNTEISEQLFQTGDNREAHFHVCQFGITSRLPPRAPQRQHCARTVLSPGTH